MICLKVKVNQTLQSGKRKDQHLKGGNWGYCQPGCDIEPVKII